MVMLDNPTSKSSTLAIIIPFSVMPNKNNGSNVDFGNK